MEREIAPPDDVFGDIPPPPRAQFEWPAARTQRIRLQDVVSGAVRDDDMAALRGDDPDSALKPLSGEVLRTRNFARRKRILKAVHGKSIDVLGGIETAAANGDITAYARPKPPCLS
jgi:hypothetical protein